MFQYKRDFEASFCGARDPAIARALNPALLTFDAWLRDKRPHPAAGLIVRWLA